MKTILKKKCFFYSSTLMICFLLISNSVFSQNEILTNTSIISLHKGGFSKSFIINKIKTSECNFELNTENLLDLKKAKVSEEIISEMMKKSQSNNNNSTNQITTPVKKNNPDVTVQNSLKGFISPTNLSSGIYFLNKEKRELQELDPSVYSQGKTGSGLGTYLSYGIAKTKSKAVLKGSAANFQTKDSTPIFYFYFDKNRKNELGQDLSTSGWFTGATTPNEFTLVKLIVSKNKKTREVVTGSFNIEGTSTGVAEEQNFDYKYEKVSPGVYKVYFLSPIPKGEFAFMYAGTGVANKVYDFSIVP